MLTMSTRQKEKQFRIIFAATYLLFLAAAIVQRMLPHAPSQFEAQSRSSRSIFREAQSLGGSDDPVRLHGLTGFHRPRSSKSGATALAPRPQGIGAEALPAAWGTRGDGRKA